MKKPLYFQMGIMEVSMPFSHLLENEEFLTFLGGHFTGEYFTIEENHAPIYCVGNITPYQKDKEENCPQEWVEALGECIEFKKYGGIILFR